jgi:hypothetical protein
MKGTLRFSVEGKSYAPIVSDAWKKIASFLEVDSAEEAKSKVDVSIEVQPSNQNNLYQADVYVRIR